MTKLDDKGRCCGRKPLHYKGGSWRSPVRAQRYCYRCNRAFDPDTGEQIENWAWALDPLKGEFARKPQA